MSLLTGHVAVATQSLINRIRSRVEDTQSTYSQIFVVSFLLDNGH
jgi:hypothetical protein